MKKLFLLLAAAPATIFASCNKNENPQTTSNGKYAICLGYTGEATSYYVITTDDLMTGSISAKGNGIEQNGYRSFQKGGDNLFSIGGLGLTDANVITRDANGNLTQKGSFVFDNSLSQIEQADANTMLAIDFPNQYSEGAQFKFYKLDIVSGARTETKSKPIADLKAASNALPYLSGMAVSGGHVYITFYLNDISVSPAVHTDYETAYVATYTWPGLEFVKVMEDDRAAICGNFNSFNGIYKVENGDMYTFSATAKANGYTVNSSKPGAMLRILAGETEFDQSYYFDVETAAGGFKPTRMFYLGGGKFFAQVHTKKWDEMTQWMDKDLKCAIVDVAARTVTYINDIPVLDGDGAMRMTCIVDGGYCYFPMTDADGLYYYRIDPATATAVRGARVEANFVSASFILE